MGQDTQKAWDHSPDPPPGTAPKAFVARSMERYKDAYTEANAVVAVGRAVKVIGVLTAAALMVAGVIGGSNAHDEMKTVMMISGFAAGVIVGIPIYVLGILTCAAGQLSLAALDTAVNSSRVLTDEQVTLVMTKRFSL